MPWHDKIDRIQLRMQKLFGEDIFPNYSNHLLFKPISDFVAVGIGPLNYDEKYVDSSEPDPALKGDMLFLAKRMKLRGPPLHIAHPEEKKIFNDYLRDHSKPTSKMWDDLAVVSRRKLTAPPHSLSYRLC